MKIFLFYYFFRILSIFYCNYKKKKIYNHRFVNYHDHEIYIQIVEVSPKMYDQIKLQDLFFFFFFFLFFFLLRNKLLDLE